MKNEATALGGQARMWGGYRVQGALLSFGLQEVSLGLALSASYSLTSLGSSKKCAWTSQDLHPLLKVNPFAMILRTQIQTFYFQFLPILLLFWVIKQAPVSSPFDHTQGRAVSGCYSGMVSAEPSLPAVTIGEVGNGVVSPDHVLYQPRPT